MINIYVTNHTPLVWNSEDAFKLRSDHRIVGSFIGSFPRQKYQNTLKYLPFQLSAEEATLLVEKGIAQLVTNSEVTQPNEEYKEKYFKHRNEQCDIQLKRMEENRVNDVMQRINQICKDKKRKAIGKDGRGGSKKQKLSETCERKSESEETDEEVDESTKKEIIEKEIDKLSLSYDNCLVQIFTEFPYKDESKNTPANWSFPQTDAEKLRYAVFKDLWEKNYYLTCGNKFGGDFLVYEGDPIGFHAIFIVICLSINQDIRSDDLVVYGRLGNQVKKTVVLASINIQNEVQYISLSWAPDVLDSKRKHQPIKPS